MRLGHQFDFMGRKIHKIFYSFLVPRLVEPLLLFKNLVIKEGKVVREGFNKLGFPRKHKFL